VIADLHSHYPMHLLGEDVSPSETYDRLVRLRRRPRWVDRVRALLIRVFARHLSYRDHASSWRVTLDGLERGRTGVVLSVLYEPFAEIDLDEPPQSDPEAGYFADLVEHLERVERELARIDPQRERHAIVRTAADLDAAVDGGRIAFVHCVEGGFHLGHTEQAIADNVADLARRGVGYVTLAHLFYRGVATNAPALPMLSDAWYDRIFRQPRRPGLSRLGEAAVRAMYDRRVLIDVSHMRADALDETFALLDRLDAETGAQPERFPVIASHSGFRFGKQAYMLDRPAIERIAQRDGVVGLILARHQLQDGRSDGDGLEHTVATIRAHVDAIHDVCGSHAHVAIGSDLDGFIKPTMSGIESAEHLALLEQPLREAYPQDADAILSGNVLRVVRRVLAQREGGGP
jgi:microsomal dipeptidase-like Zn-dependent dipeptidase